MPAKRGGICRHVGAGEVTAVDFAKVNRELTAVLGHGVAELRPARGHSFVLYFFSDNPTPRQIKKAKRIVGRHEKTAWGKPQGVGGRR